MLIQTYAMTGLPVTPAEIGRSAIEAAGVMLPLKGAATTRIDA